MFINLFHISLSLNVTTISGFLDFLGTVPRNSDEEITHLCQTLSNILKQIGKNYYVYYIRLGGRIVYIGAGRGMRVFNHFKRAVQGKHDNPMFNTIPDSVANGEDLSVEIKSHGLTRRTALAYEKNDIAQMEPLWNRQGGTSSYTASKSHNRAIILDELYTIDSYTSVICNVNQIITYASLLISMYRSGKIDAHGESVRSLSLNTGFVKETTSRHIHGLINSGLIGRNSYGNQYHAARYKLLSQHSKDISPHRAVNLQLIEQVIQVLGNSSYSGSRHMLVILLLLLIKGNQTISTLANWLDRSDKSIIKYLDLLQDLGLIHIKRLKVQVNHSGLDAFISENASQPVIDKRTNLYDLQRLNFIIDKTIQDIKSLGGLITSSYYHGMVFGGVRDCIHYIKEHTGSYLLMLQKYQQEAVF